MWPWVYLWASEDSEAFLDELLHSPRSAPALLAGTLPLRYCAVRFASRRPTWRLPVPGHAAGLIASGVAEVVLDGEGVSWDSGSSLGRRRIRLNRKTPAHFVSISGAQSRPRVWKRLRHRGRSVGVLADVKRRRLDQQNDGFVLVQNRSGVG